MPGGFSNKPKILRGAFIEYGLSLPPLFVVFQFNPEQLTRNRNLSFSVPSWRQEKARQSEGVESSITLRDFHKEFDDLTELRDAQQVEVQPESINFEIRLDATDKLSEGDKITTEFGIGPRLSTLEMMVYPKEESLLGKALGSLFGSKNGFSFTKGENPPMILFIWGRTRVLPININSLNITETMFDKKLNPVRATVSINLTVIEGKNMFYMYTKAAKEVMSALSLDNITDIADVVIPG